MIAAPRIPYYVPPTIIEPQLAQFLLPAFTLAVPAWAGASGILAQYPFNNTTPISLKLPIGSFGSNFIAAVRWMEQEDIFVRYLLFEHEDAVLYYPLYNGERMQPGAVLEIWSVDSLVAPTLEEDLTLYSSQLIFPIVEQGRCGCCCENESLITTLVPVEPTVLPPGSPCNPFCGDLCNTEPPMPVCECPIVVVDNVAAGRAYTPDVFISPALLVTQGGAVPGDTLGKAFRWDAASVAVDDGTIETTVIRPNNIDASAPGRWLQTSLG